jgi:Uma2 family endonuclease
MQLASLDQNKTYSYADYYTWDFENRVELINGKIFELSPAPSPYHQEISLDIAFPLKNFLQGKPCKVYYAPFDVRLPRKSTEDKEILTVLQPDICIICDLSKIDKRGCIGPPDIVVEILSPGNSAKEMKNKYEAYQDAGVKEYWVVIPQNQLFLVHTLINGKFELEPVKAVGDKVTSSVLPGFSLDLTDLFKNAPARGE